MPIVDIHYENGVFFAREVDYIEVQDARLWAQKLAEYAVSSPTPIIALIDARTVSALSSDARRMFALAAETPNVRVAVVVLNPANRLVVQQSRITALLSAMRKTHETYFFDSADEAMQYVRQQMSAPAQTG